MNLPIARWHRQTAPLVLACFAIAAIEGEAEVAENVAANEAELEEITVIAHPLSGEGLSEAAVVLAGEELEREVAASIGATVGRQPGIHNATFGAAVGRPVVHGMSGPRVRVMEDRIDTMDVAVSSADHATTVESYLAERIEVIKGPSTLLYGSGAIGGVVDVHTGRVPHHLPEALTGRVVWRGTDNGDGRNAAVRFDGGGGRLAWHVDGFARDAADYDIPGLAESAAQHAAEEAEEAEDHEEGDHDDDHEEPGHDEDDQADGDAGKLLGSHAEGRGGAIGFSFVGDRGFAGISVSRLQYDYGVPGHAHEHEEDEHEEDEHGDDEAGEEHHDEAGEEHHDEEEEHGVDEGVPTLDLEQTRIDFEAGWTDPGARLSSINIHFGVNDYGHVEIEPDGAIGTRFIMDAYEGRIELVQDDDLGLDGALGAQFGRREFAAIGEEAVVPPVTTNTVGTFWVGEKTYDSFDLETGARIERVAHDPSHGAGTRFTALSASLGMVRQLGSALLGVNGGYSSRAPAVEELYSNGTHLATRSFEIGDPVLSSETALHGAATLAWRNDRAELSATAYVTSFRDHIYQSATGEERDHLPVYRFSQADASYRGIDLAGRLTVAEFALGSVALTAMFDTVDAELDVVGNGRVPRLPPTRYGLGLDAELGRVSAVLDYRRMAAQDETAVSELPTPAYDDLRLHVASDFSWGDADLRVFFQGRNLTDDEQRHHSSFLKDLAPAPGRTLEVGIRAAF